MFSYISKETPPILNVYETLNETFKIFEAFSLGFSRKTRIQRSLTAKHNK